MRYNERSDSGSGRSREKGSSARTGQNSRRSSAGGAAARSTSARGSAAGTTARGTSSRSSAGSGRTGTAGGGTRRAGLAAGASGRSGGASRGASGRGRSGSRSNYQYKGGRGSGRRGSGRRGGGGGFVKLAVGGVLLILAITCIAFLMKGMKKDGSEPTEVETTTAAETELLQNVRVDGIDITGMSRSEAKSAILKDYPWAMKVTWEDNSYEVANLMADKLDALLDEIYSGKAKEDYTLDTTGLEEYAKAEAANVAAQWNKKAKNGSVSGYDAAADKFLFAGAQTGIAVDQEKLASDILAAVSDKKFDAVIKASVNTVEPEFSEATAKERFKKIGTFTTKTTANAKRNTNVKLSAQAINGTVIQPGQEFSFNGTVGERTAAKGYQGAAAYNNGEVVEEIGGGVCQTSSTLYNAVVKAGLKTTVRRSHTYEPSYVTPGTDATVSWGGPDYKFVNNTSSGIGIRAHYADQTLTVSIYGIPVLAEGETRSLKSTKLSDMDLPAPTYEEDQTLQPGVEKVKSKGSQGSKWETRLVITKDGKVVSEDVDHSVTYKGHVPVILRNTTGTVLETKPGETTADGTINPSQSSPAPEGAGDGLHQEGTGNPTEGTVTVPESSAAQKPTTGSQKPEGGEKPSGSGEKPGSNEAPPTVAPTTAANPGGNNPDGAAPAPEGTKPSDTSAAPSAGSQKPGSSAPEGGSPMPTIPPMPGV